MKIAFIGGGASSLFSAIYLKKKNSSLDIFIVEKNDSLGKKLSLTGNGKCNLGPLPGEYENKYNQSQFVKSLFAEIDDSEYQNLLSFIGVETKCIKGRGLYPISESTKNVIAILNNELEKLGIKAIKDTIKDYLINDGVILLGEKEKYQFDKVVFATGGKSYPKTGSDGLLFDVFKKHGYEIVNLEPSLCPLKTKENVDELFGVRFKCEVSLYKDNDLIDKECGEVIFKKDGLSGIAIMNLSRHIKKGNYYIKINSLKSDDFEIKNSDFTAKKPVNLENLYKYVPIKMAKYLLKNSKKSNLFTILSDISFSIKSKYDFDEAQVTSGGLSIHEINSDMSSKKEKNVYFIGEMLDVDGACGGYNLRFAITSGIIACLSILNK